MDKYLHYNNISASIQNGGDISNDYENKKGYSYPSEMNSWEEDGIEIPDRYLTRKRRYIREYRDLDDPNQICNTVRQLISYEDL